MVKQGHPQDGFNGGVTIASKTSPYSSNLHTEVNTILESFGSQGNNTYMGVLELLYRSELISAPLIAATELNKAMMYTPGFGSTITYSVLHEMGLPFLKEVLLDKTVSKPGIEGSYFGIVLSEDCYTNMDVLTDDYRNGVELQVHLTEPVVPYNGGFLYYVRLASNNPEEFVSWKHLTIGSRWVKIDNSSGEFDTNISGLSNNRVGNILMSYNTGNTEIRVGHSITSFADMLDVQPLADSNISALGAGYNNMSINDQKAITNWYNMGPDGKPIKGSLAWMPTIIQQIMKELMDMKEKRMMWSKGYSFRGITGKINRVPTGYYQWIRQFGGYHSYTSHHQLPNILKNIVGQMFTGKNHVDPKDRRVKFRMGTGAMQVMRQEFMTQFKADNPFLIINDGRNPNLNGMLTGPDVQNLAYKPMRIVSYQYPEVGIVEIEHEPALDHIDDKFENQSFSGQLPNSSFMIFVEDISLPSVSNANIRSGATAGSDFNNGTNIVQIRPKKYEDTLDFLIGSGCSPTLKKFVKYDDNTKVISTPAKGFQVIASTCGEIFVKDPSRSILIEYRPYV